MPTTYAFPVGIDNDKWLLMAHDGMFFITRSIDSLSLHGKTFRLGVHGVFFFFFFFFFERWEGYFLDTSSYLGYGYLFF